MLNSTFCLHQSAYQNCTLTACELRCSEPCLSSGYEIWQFEETMCHVLTEARLQTRAHAWHSLIARICKKSLYFSYNADYCSCYLQSSSPAEIAWESQGGVTYIRPTEVSSTVPPVVQTSRCSEWRRHGFHLVPQVHVVSFLSC